jgi:hypothetical protein
MQRAAAQARIMNIINASQNNNQQKKVSRKEDGGQFSFSSSLYRDKKNRNERGTNFRFDSFFFVFRIQPDGPFLRLEAFLHLFAVVMSV